MLLRKLFLVLFFSPLYLLAQNRYDVVIDEIMADQTPQIGLPSNEWIELKNVSANPVNLQNWRIGDATGLSGPMPNFVLKKINNKILMPAAHIPLGGWGQKIKPSVLEGFKLLYDHIHNAVNLPLGMFLCAFCMFLICHSELQR